MTEEKGRLLFKTHSVPPRLQIIAYILVNLTILSGVLINIHNNPSKTMVYLQFMLLMACLMVFPAITLPYLYNTSKIYEEGFIPNIVLERQSLKNILLGTPKFYRWDDPQIRYTLLFLPKPGIDKILYPFDKSPFWEIQIVNPTFEKFKFRYVLCSSHDLNVPPSKAYELLVNSGFFNRKNYLDPQEFMRLYGHLIVGVGDW